jgi:hypothetical protein
MATIKIEGQTIKGDAVGITDEIANDDELLKAALAPTWPDVRTATINRSGGKDGKELVVSVTKKAGVKGMDDSEIEEQERHDRKKAREEAEAERVRKLEDLALAADRFFSTWSEFGGRPAADIVSAISEYVDDLGEAFDKIGADEIARIRSERRGA